MYKNQLQELAQRSCFNLPSYTCIREGPDHAPRFRASVNFNGEIFEGPSYCTTLRQAEHAAAEVALNTLSTRVPPKSLAAKVLDETGVYKNLLQETAHRAGLNLPVYTTVRSGPGHLPVFTCSVELAGMSFNGEPARTKKQAEKNAAMAAWSALKQMPNLNSLSQTNKEFSDISEEQEPVIVARALSALRPKDESTKQVRQREHQQNVLRKKMMMSYRDRNPNHSISSRCHQWRWQDLMSDVSLYSTQRQTQLHNRAHQQSLLLPLSAPPPGPKLLPSMNIYRQQQNQVELPSQSSSSVFSREASPSIGNQTRQSIAVQIKTKPLIKTQEIATPLGDHLKDEEEWLTGSKKPANARSFRANQPPLGSRILPPRMFCAMDFPTHSMAPAVQIRSVIPVCAAPPIRPPTPVQDQIHNQEASASNSKQEISSDTVAITMANLSLLAKLPPH